jgi:phage tail sheath gpL-like
MADIPFHQIPSNVRVPLFYAEVDPSHANTATPNLRALLIGGKTAAGTGVANQPVILTSVDDARVQAGAGSTLAGMAFTYRKNDPFGELWMLPVSDAGGAVAATGSIAFTGPATAAGVLSLYIAGALVSVAVSSGMAATALATAVAAAITALPNLPVTAAVNGGVPSKVDITAKNAGLTGNDIDIRLNYRGTASGEATPAGITPTIVAMANGATNPTLGTALANLQDLPFEFIACAYTDAASLTALTAFLNDTAGRWSWQVQIYGHSWWPTAAPSRRADHLGVTLNDPHMSRSASTTRRRRCGGCRGSGRPDGDQRARRPGPADPRGRPAGRAGAAGQLALQPQPAQHPAVRRHLDLQRRQGRQRDPGEADHHLPVQHLQGQADNSLLDAETLFNLAGVLRRLKGLVDQQVRPRQARGRRHLPDPRLRRRDAEHHPRRHHRPLPRDGGGRPVQQSALFAQSLVVQKNSTNPNRVDVLWPAS